MTNTQDNISSSRETQRESDRILLEVLNLDGTLRSAHILDQDEMGLLPYSYPANYLMYRWTLL